MKEFKKQKNGSYDLTINKRDFNGEQQAVMMSVNNEPDQKTSLSITGRESQKDVYLKLDLRRYSLSYRLETESGLLRHIGNHFLEMC